MQKTVAIIGCGSMGTAILAGMLHHGYKPEQIKLTTRTVEKADGLAKKYMVTAYATEYQPNANSLATEGADLIIIAVKPLNVSKVLDEIAVVLDPNALVVSVAAGITIETMSKHVAKTNQVVRAMPNTPALVGKGVTGIAFGVSVSQEQRMQVEELFSAVGKTLVIEEEQIDALSTISGSGPAYVFFFIEEFIKAAKEHGFSEDQAYLMVTETFLGASLLLTKTQADPAELRRQVTSPNGTTMKAIAILEEGNLEDLFVKATKAALARAKEIAQEN
ncbi:MAG: pyrroline-5-carboxylate reductase [Rhodoluna sp.]|jgi:pyrroline-5-carboxylate reductase